MKEKHQQAQAKGPVALLVCAIGICSCYLYYGFLQERYFSGEKRIGANFALVSQTATNSIVALGWSRVQHVGSTSTHKQIAAHQSSSLNHPLLLLTAFWYIGAMSTSNYSFQYVSYPTAVLAKSCKLIPTMLMSILIERKTYSFQEWLAAGCISCGIVLFNLSRLSTGADKKDSTHGLVLLLISLCMDGFLGSCQGLLKRRDTRLHGGSTQQRRREQRPPTAMETMLYVNLYALVFLIPMAVYTGEWSHGMSRLPEMYEGLLLLNAAAASGQIFIFVTLTWFSPLVCTTITTTRKFFTILLSVLHFGHTFTWTQWSAVGLVFGGLYTGIVHKAGGTAARGSQEKLCVKGDSIKQD